MKRLVINRLDLDLHGVSAATAEDVARLVGPALAQALRGRRLDHIASAQAIDAGRLAVPTAKEPGAMATQIAQHIAHKSSGD